MRLGLISDTHDVLRNLKAALDHFRREQISVVLHAGDVTGAETLRALQEFDLWLAWGNVDSEELQPLAESLFGPGRMALLHSLDFEGVRLALIHGDSRPRLDLLIDSGEYRYVIHGHTHVPRDERIGPTRVINPGCLGGTARWREHTYAILDLPSDTLEQFTL